MPSSTSEFSDPSVPYQNMETGRNYLWPIAHSYSCTFLNLEVSHNTQIPRLIPLPNNYNQTALGHFRAQGCSHEVFILGKLDKRFWKALAASCLARKFWEFGQMEGVGEGPLFGFLPQLPGLFLRVREGPRSEDFGEPSWTGIRIQGCLWAVVASTFVCEHIGSSLHLFPRKLVSPVLVLNVN